MAELSELTQKPNYDSIAEEITAGVVKVISAEGIQKALVSATTEGAGSALSLYIKVAGTVGRALGKMMIFAEAPFLPAIGGVSGTTASTIFVEWSPGYA